MTGKNRDHVRVSTDSGINWTFIVPSGAATCSEQADEITALGTQLFDSFGDFLSPIELTYQIQAYSTGQTLPYGDDAAEPIETVVRNVRGDSGVTVDDFVVSTRIEGSKDPLIPRLPFDHNQLRLRLDGVDKIVDRTDCVVYKKGVHVNEGPTWDPLTLTISFAPNRQYDDIDSAYLFHLSVSLRSDIWLERTKQGEANRAYLSEFLERLADTVPIKRVERDIYGASDMWVDLGIQNPVKNVDPSDIY